MTASTFLPRWASVPGDTIIELIESRNISRNDLIESLQISHADFDRLINGTFRIHRHLATQLSEKLGGSESFWLKRDAIYREQEELLRADAWVKSLPLTSIRQTSNIDIPRQWDKRIQACFTFFGVSSLNEWSMKYASGNFGVRFRTSEVFRSKLPAVAVWLRMGEIEARDFVTPFDRNLLLSAIPRIRRLTKVASPDEFLPALRSELGVAGVLCMLIPAPTGCVASGASRILENGSAVIQLSGRHLSDDQFWFSVFHEIGHLLMHEGVPIHVDAEDARSGGPEEVEANQFASDVLWPHDERPNLAGANVTKRGVLHLASRARTSPGIIVGQLQKSGALEYSQLNFLKRRYVRSGNSISLRSDV